MRLGDFDPPFFHFSDDLIVFDMLDDMVHFIEPVDVGDADRAFDSLGRRVVLRAEGVERTRWTVGGGTTTFDADASGALARDDLTRRLREHPMRWAQIAWASRVTSSISLTSPRSSRPSLGST